MLRREFHYQGDSSNKFWAISLEGKSFTVNFGKGGTAGQTQVKSFASEIAAKIEYDKLVLEKTKKGYIEAAGSGTPAVAAPPKPVAAPVTPVKKAVMEDDDDEDFEDEEEEQEVPAGPSKAGKREFHFSEGDSNKFWAISLDGKSFTVVYGKIGTAGVTQVKSFANVAEAKGQYDKLILEKVKKGYDEVDAQPTPIAPAIVAPKPVAAVPALPVKKAVVEDDDEDEFEDDEEAPAGTSKGGRREFHFTEGDSNKFWAISLEVKSFTVVYGKIGTAGVTQLKSFASEAEAKVQYQKLILEKTKKGYEEVDAETAPVAPAAHAPIAPKPATVPVKKAVVEEDDDDDFEDEDEDEEDEDEAPASVGGSDIPKREFHFSEGSSNKFWSITLAGTGFKVHFGKIGTAGLMQEKSYSTETEAKAQYNKLVLEKTKKGYVEVGGSAKPAAATSTPSTSSSKPAPLNIQVWNVSSEDEAEEEDEDDEDSGDDEDGESSGGRREFQFSDGSSDKFWAITLKGDSFTVNFGKTGTAGQTQEKTFGSEAEAKVQYEKLILEKTKKGYEEVEE